MNTTLLDRFYSLEATPQRLEFRHEGYAIVVHPSRASVRRLQVLVRAAGLIGMFLGLVITPMSLWGLIVAGLGGAAAWKGYHLIRTDPLLRLEARRLVALQQDDLEVAYDTIREIDGRYEIFGWTARTAVYAVTDEGEVGPILVLHGTDESLAIYACRTLGMLLNVPARYDGPFDKHTQCFVPEPEDAEMAL